MATKLLTDLRVRNARSKAENLLSDGEGLYLRVRPTGKDWQFIYSFEGRRRKQGLGPYPDISLENARERASASRTSIAQGRDPISAREVERVAVQAREAAQKARHTVLTLFEEWHRKEASGRKDKGAEIRRALEKDVLPTLGDRFADEIKRRDIMCVLDTVKERGSNRIANLLLQYLRQMFRFAVVRETVSLDPTYGLVKKDVGGAEGVRDRHLKEDEIRELVTRIPGSGLTPAAEAAIWIMLATCCRVGELSKARWAEIKLKDRLWTIPAENAKNGETHLVHLSKFALRNFELLRGLQAGSEWVFPDTRNCSHIDTKALQKMYRDRQREVQLKGRSKELGSLLLSGGEWRAHDLRRSGATLMGELGVRPDVIERCLNHVGTDRLVKIYQHQEILAERRDAFERLGERLELLAISKKKKSPQAKLRPKRAS